MIPENDFEYENYKEFIDDETCISSRVVIGGKVHYLLLGVVYKTPYLDQAVAGIERVDLNFGLSTGNFGSSVKFGNYVPKLLTWSSVRDGGKNGLQGGGGGHKEHKEDVF